MLITERAAEDEGEGETSSSQLENDSSPSPPPPCQTDTSPQDLALDYPALQQPFSQASNFHVHANAAGYDGC